MNPRCWLAAGVYVSTNAYVKVIGVRRQRGYGRDTLRGSSVTGRGEDPPVTGPDR